MRQPKDRKPIESRQLCAIAREAIQADPTIDDAEWKARIKARIVRMEFTYPADPEAIERAMAQVERAVKRPAPKPPETAPPARRETGPPLTPEEAKRFLETIHQHAARSPTPGSSSGPCRLSNGAPAALETILAGRSRPSGPNRTAEQIAAWRAATPRDAEFVRTARGWEKHR